MSDKQKVKKIEAMSYAERLAYFCGGKVTVGFVDQAFEKRLKRSYVAKIRGIVVGDVDDYLHSTEEEARNYGEEILRTWRAELAEALKGEANE